MIFFQDAHSGSSRCSPSRYMLMTGRYSLENKRERKIEVGREPHLGSMFKKAGYTTSIFGKSQPLKTDVKNEIFKNVESRHKKVLEWRKSWVGKKFNARKDDM